MFSFFDLSWLENEGVRRPICDMALVIFHLFLSSFTFDGIDVLMAQQIIDWNLKRFPNGEFEEYSLFALMTCSRFRKVSFSSSELVKPHSCAVNLVWPSGTIPKRSNLNLNIETCTIYRSGK
jgi:hypothetical protein